MAMPASRFVRLPSPHHDRGTVPGSGLSVDEPLIPGRRAAAHDADRLELVHHLGDAHEGDRKSTRLNSSHDQISYAVFCLKKKSHRLLFPALARLLLTRLLNYVPLHH